MGISCVASYCGAAGRSRRSGCGAEVMELCFPAVPSRIGGADLAALEAPGRRARTAEMPDHGRVRFRKAGEHHAYNPLAVRAAQKAAHDADPAAYREWRRLSSAGQPQSLRDLMRLDDRLRPWPLEEVEPAREIIKRFVTTAMSLGALSPEAHEALAIAMNQVGARSNSGEGGEDPDTYDARAGRRTRQQDQAGRLGPLRRHPALPASAPKSWRSRSPRAPSRARAASCPGSRSPSLIARLRHAQPGMQLISPPPHHDIYSIEDLAQLIHDLKTVNPRARIGVKLVSEAGVGTIAAGVAKAQADYVLISGHDGGTGASPLSSIKSAGAPWELGLAETQQVLVAQRPARARAACAPTAGCAAAATS